jgi:chromosome segregation ATPase
MGKDLESTMKWKVDISQFKSAITEANNSIKLANSEFKKASAGMDDWTKSEEGLAAKMRQLSAVADAQQRKVDVLRQQYEETARAQGEDSEAAQKLLIQLNNQEAALESTKKEMRKYSEGVDEAGEETKETTQSFSAMKVAIGNLIADGIKKLISSLGKLKDA